MIHNVNDYVKLTDEEIDWFDKNLIWGGGLKSQTRPDLERGMLLYYLCKKIKAKKVLDIGTASFFSARSMAKYCEVDTIDIKGSMPEVPYKNVNFIKGDSKEVLPRLVAEGKKYDLIFVDGDHSYAGVKADLIQCKKMSSLIVCHDFGNLLDVTRAINEELSGFDVVLADRMWVGAPYENGVDKNGNRIDYGIVVYGFKNS